VQIATWNVNSIRTRLPHVLAWLERNRSEVLCLQETKVEDSGFPVQSFNALGYECVTDGQKTYNGVAILSTRAIEKVGRGFEALLPGDQGAPTYDAQKRVLSACIDGVRIVNVYVPNGSSLQSEKFAFKLGWLAVLQRYLQRCCDGSEPLCMVGDFNIALAARDLHDPERLSGGIMASEAERDALLSALGGQLQDVFRTFEPEAGHWSWWDYRRGSWERDCGWRIDHIYADDTLLAQSTGCWIDRAERGRTQPSDHAPVVMSLSWPPRIDDEGQDDQPIGWG